MLTGVLFRKVTKPTTDDEDTLSELPTSRPASQASSDLPPSSSGRRRSTAVTRNSSSASSRSSRQKPSFAIQPEFVNQYILTDALLSSLSTPALNPRHISHSPSRRIHHRPIIPSIATLVNPLSSIFTICLTILRTVCFVVLSHLPGSKQAIKKISVANTAVLFHDGRALATCESGPPMRVLLPGLETVGWFDGKNVGPQPKRIEGSEALEGEDRNESGPGFGGTGPLAWMKEWTTGHPRVDPMTGELIAYHNSFFAPYVHYSILPSTQHLVGKQPLLAPQRLLSVPVPGVSGAKMMHDFGVSLNHTVILDLPLSLTPFNLLRNTPVVSYDPTLRSRFGVFPRYRPDLVRWFETNPCCIFHTANTWDSIETDPATDEAQLSVNMLVCRLTSASLVYSAGNITAPSAAKAVPAEYEEEEQCRLYYYQFPYSSPSARRRDSSDSATSTDALLMDALLDEQNIPHAADENGLSSAGIRHQFALSAIPFEFPTLSKSCTMSAARHVYGCSIHGGSFGAALGKAAKINVIAKIDAQALIKRGTEHPPADGLKGCVDTRAVDEILAGQRRRQRLAAPDRDAEDERDPIQLFAMPAGWFAQEASFVARDGAAAEDDGWLVMYVFDEAQLERASGAARPDAASELWIVDARGMRDVVARVCLPQRVPYGLHGTWFTEAELRGQRECRGLRALPDGHGVALEVEGAAFDRELREVILRNGADAGNGLDGRDGRDGAGETGTAAEGGPLWRAWMGLRSRLEWALA